MTYKAMLNAECLTILSGIRARQNNKDEIRLPHPYLTRFYVKVSDVTDYSS